MSNILLRPKNSRCQSHQQKEQEIHAQLCGGTYDFAHVAVAIDLNSSRFQLYDVRCVERDLCTLLPVMSEILSDCCARNLTIFYGAQSQHSRVQHASVLTVHGSVLTDGISRKVEKRVDHKIGLIPSILDGSRTHLTSNYSDSGDLLQQLTLIWNHCTSVESDCGIQPPQWWAIQRHHPCLETQGDRGLLVGTQVSLPAPLLSKERSLVESSSVGIY
eukprot:g58184.t1